jgi:hypothetical protein
MFQKSFFRNLFVGAILFAANILNAAPPMQLITLRAGTAISLTLNEEVDSESWSVGNSLDFMVRSNVTVNGKVLIAAGSIATGLVKKVNSVCDGSCDGCASITITVESVQSVDGQVIYLRSIPHVIKAPCCYGAASGNIGTNLSARVLNDVQIDG